jgi:hypothetical protein
MTVEPDRLACAGVDVVAIVTTTTTAISRYTDVVDRILHRSDAPGRRSHSVGGTP